MGKQSEPLFRQWEAFCEYIVRKNRFALDANQNDFIQKVLFSARKRKTIIDKGEIFWRSRIGPGLVEKNSEIVNEIIPIKEMGAPKPEQCTAGRANCSMIPHLYLSKDCETALAECRPYINAYITLCKFELNTALSIIDILPDNTFPGIGETLTDEQYLWYGIGLYFSVPIKPSDSTKFYIPTQYLSELLKKEGYDGIRYGSSQRKNSYNLVVFDEKKADKKELKTLKVEDIEYKTILPA